MFIPLGLALIRSSVPLIASEHIVAHHYHSRHLEALLLRLTPFLVWCITCVSEQAISSYSDCLQRVMVVVPNPVTVQATSRADVIAAGRPRKTLLSLGRLEPQKDHAILVEAFAQVADDLPDWDLRIVGEGSLRPALESLINKLGLNGRVFLPGATKNVAAEYLGAQLFVLASRYESFGLTTAEALGHGLPVVGFSDCPGTNRLIRPRINGALADGNVSRAQSLARELKTLMSSGRLRARLADQAAFSGREYKLENVCDRWEQLLQTVAGCLKSSALQSDS
jgi:glycosyltransferase involved in cell wall biosynthesis